MQTAPVGLGAYFAYQVGFGPTCLSTYAKPLGLYYAVLHFMFFFSLYAYMAGGKLGFKVGKIT
jgi:hypothetical protein